MIFNRLKKIPALLITTAVTVMLIFSLTANYSKAYGSAEDFSVQKYDALESTERKILKREVLNNLKKIGIPVASGSGKFNEEQARSLCLGRLLTDRKAHRGALTKQERVLLANETQLTPPSWAKPGLNVSVKCQGAFWLAGDKVTRIMPVSTGRPGYETRVGSYIVKRQWDGWHNSTEYGTPLYKTSYFSGGQAVHGLKSDSLVKPYPASAGCVRMHKKDAKWVYNKILGKRITIRGEW